MANELFCMGCMQPISEFSESCYHCGYPAAGQNPVGYLPVRTQLSNRYVVGRALEKRSDAVVYIGYDKTARNTVLIREFYPEGLCERLSRQIVACVGKERAFAEMLEQFRRQARIIARMRELPAMIPVYDLFDENGTVYTVSDQVEGIPLRRYVQSLGGHMKWEEARPLFVPLISALVSLHAAGLYHLGISPDSIIIDGDHRLRLDGWQLEAVRVEGGPLLNKLPVGYAAPEQYKNRAAEVSQSADVYAVSATMLYALTGEEPPSAIDRVNKVASLLVPADVAEKWPAYIAPTLCDALHLDVTKRIPTAELLRERLTVAPVVEALIEDVDPAVALAPRTGASAEEEREKSSAGWIVTTIILAVLCVALVGAVVWLLLYGSPFVKKSDVETPVDEPAQTTNVSPSTTATTVPTTALVDPFATPNLLGMTIGQAYEKAANGELNGSMKVTVVDTDYSDQYAQGVILSQYPEPQAMAEKGTVIEVCVSAGPQITTMVDVTGWNNEAARIYLESLGFRVSEITVYRVGAAYETVVETDPIVGAPVTMGQEIVLHVNRDRSADGGNN